MSLWIHNQWSWSGFSGARRQEQNVSYYTACLVFLASFFFWQFFPLPLSSLMGCSQISHGKHKHVVRYHKAILMECQGMLLHINTWPQLPSLSQWFWLTQIGNLNCEVGLRGIAFCSRITFCLNRLAYDRSTICGFLRDVHLGKMLNFFAGFWQTGVVLTAHVCQQPSFNESSHFQTCLIKIQ